MLIAHELGPQQFGSFSFIFNLLGLLGLLADFETTRVVMTELGRTGDENLSSIASRFIVFRLALGLVTYGLALLIVWIGPYSNVEVQGVAIGGLSLIIASALWSLISVCQAKQWLRVVAGSLVVGQVAQFAVIIAIFTGHRGSLLRYVAPFVLSDIVALICIGTVVGRSLRIRPRIHLSSWRHWFVEAAPLAVGSALATLYFRIDSLMLTLVLHGSESRVAVGLYQIGYKFSDLLAFVAPALIAAMLPVLARAWPKDPVAFHRTVRQGIVLVVIIAGFAVAEFAVFAGPVINHVLGSEFSAAQTSARWLVFGQALNFFTQIVYMCLITVHRRRMYPVITLCGLAINVGLNLMFIPRYTVNGAAAATIFTEVVVLVLLIAQVMDLPLRPLPTRSAIIALVSAGMSAAVGAALLLVVWWWLAILGSVVAYPACLHFLRVDGPGGLRALWERSHFATP